ncbi:hypothetical protein V8F20_007429 [Naviculisporaceae sp. PSN 640]
MKPIHEPTIPSGMSRQQLEVYCELLLLHPDSENHPNVPIDDLIDHHYPPIDLVPLEETGHPTSAPQNLGNEAAMRATHQHTADGAFASANGLMPAAHQFAEQHSARNYNINQAGGPALAAFNLAAYNMRRTLHKSPVSTLSSGSFPCSISTRSSQRSLIWGPYSDVWGPDASGSDRPWPVQNGENAPLLPPTKASEAKLTSKFRKFWS